MVWPTDDLTTTHLDASTDDPGLARAELKAAVDKIKSILGEVPAGSTVWHSSNDGPGGSPSLDAATLGGAGKDSAYHLNLANATGTLAASKVSDGPGSGLNADQLDSQDGSYYLDIGNATGTLNTARIGNDSITASKIAANAIKTPEISTMTEESQSGVAVAARTYVILSSGEYGFIPQVKTANNTTTAQLEAVVGFRGSVAATCTTSYTTRMVLFGVTSITAITARIRYVTSSPPYRLGTEDIPLFAWVQLDSNDNIMAIQTSHTPPWAYNGPTNIRPDKKDPITGQYLVRKRSIDEETGEVSIIDQPITHELKNADMDLIPQPFLSREPGDKVILLDPPETLYLKELHESGESVCDLLQDDYLRLDNSTIIRATPNGVLPAKFKWKNTRARVGEAAKDRRLKRGVFSDDQNEVQRTRDNIKENRRRRTREGGRGGTDR